MLNAQQAAAKWLRQAQAAGPNIQAAVQAMQEADNPMAKAAASESAWIEGCRKANQTNKFSQRVGAVSFQAWKQAMIQKGIPNYQNGLAAGAQKMVNFLTVFLPFVQQVKAQLPPRGTLQQNIARMTQMVQALSQFQMGVIANPVNPPNLGFQPLGF